MAALALSRFGGPDFGDEEAPATHSSTAVVPKMSRQAQSGHVSGYQWGSSALTVSAALQNTAEVSQLDLLGSLLARGVGRAGQRGGHIGRVREAAPLGAGGDQLEN